MIDHINEMPEDGLKSSPEASRYRANTWISRKIKINCTFLYLIDILNDLILMNYLLHLIKKNYFGLRLQIFKEF